jgi:hypothetical protein
LGESDLSKRRFSGIIVALLLVGMLALTVYIQSSKADFEVSETPATSSQPIFKVIPEVIELGPGHVVGQTFVIAVVVENICGSVEFYGLDVQFSWNTSYLECLDHTVTIPVEDFPDPIPPSPYHGILFKPLIIVKDVVDANAGTYWVSCACIYPAPAFFGNGTVFVMTFRVKHQSNVDIEVPLHFIYPTIGMPESRVIEDGLVKIPAIPLPHPPEARFTIIPGTANVGQLVMFDASSSLSGGNETHEKPITRYYWDFGDGNKTELSTLIVHHSFSSPGNYDVNLIVSALGAKPERDSITHQVTIYSLPTIGGYSFPLLGNATGPPLTQYLTTVAILTTIFTTIKYKKHKRTKTTAKDAISRNS